LEWQELVTSKAWVILVVVGFAAATTLYFNYSPYDYDFYPRCPSQSLLGLKCPGCGSQRALHDLLHLRVGSAFVANPLMVLAIPYVLVGYYAEWQASRSMFWQRIRKLFWGQRAIWILLLVIVGFTVWRNG
jgi:hypothetical protein